MPNKTPLGLNQWLPSDKPKMNDFNADNVIIDQALRSLNEKFAHNAGAHNSHYRGMQRGGSDGRPTASEYEAIRSNEFIATVGGETADLYIGDYWTIGGVDYDIGCFNYFYNCGDTALTTPHALLVPRQSLYNAQMNESNVTTGGYAGSLMRTTNLEQAKTIINAAFNGHVLTHGEYLTNAITGGRASGGAWFDCTVELMNELMVYGNGVYTPVSDGTTVPTNYTISKSQLPLFAMRPDLISNRITYWLRDAISGTYFAAINVRGGAYYAVASGSYGVRPFFLIKGESA